MNVFLSAKGAVVEDRRDVPEVKISRSGMLDEALSSPKKIKKAAIVNLINHIHFTGGVIRAHIRNPATGDEFIATASPEPCADDNLTARWLKRGDFNPADFILLNVILHEGKSIIVVPVETIRATDDLFIAALPEKGHRWNRRRSRRYPARNGINAEIIQDNNRLDGSLVDFNCSSFSVKLDAECPFPFDRLDIDRRFFIRLCGEKIVYSGLCSYVKEDIQGNDRLVVLAPENTSKQKIKRENRNPRVKLTPTPKIVFNHPLTDKTMEFELADISSSGFSILSGKDESPFMPCLLIQELVIAINGSVYLRCTAVIVYEIKADENNFKYGFSILEMEMEAFNRLFAIICKADNPHVNLSPELDLNDLWEFFFKSKFIYPKKYKLIESNIGEIKDTYSRLYRKGGEIFSYITYQENGKILGHCSMIRAYQRAWLVQHLTAISSENTNLAGIQLLYQILNYADTMFKFPSSKLDYLMFYYRPDNKFSEFFFWRNL